MGDIHLPLAAALSFTLQPSGFRMIGVEGWKPNPTICFAPRAPALQFLDYPALMGVIDQAQFRVLEPLLGPSLASDAQARGAAGYAAAITLLRELIT